MAITKKDEFLEAAFDLGQASAAASRFLEAFCAFVALASAFARCADAPCMPTTAQLVAPTARTTTTAAAASAGWRFTILTARSSALAGRAMVGTPRR